MTTESRTKKPADIVHRRGVFAAAWAAVVGLVLHKTTKPVEAAANMQFQNVGGGALLWNAAGGPTGAYATASFTVAGSVLVGLASGGSSRCGVHGGHSATLNPPPMDCGVYGFMAENDDPGSQSAGIVGDDLTGTGSGVLGRHLIPGAGAGVRGESNTGYGLFGLISGGSPNTIAMYGLNNSTSPGGGPGAGGFGIYGFSAKGHGLVGATGTAGGAAVVGATNGVQGAYAGVFYGPVVVTGSFVVQGAKSAALPHPDGTHRLVYCVESPESWLEDFGTSRLECGRADITLDKDFAAVANLDDYHVFVTGYDAEYPLYVKQRSSTGFVVQADGSATARLGPQADAAFSWRIVARRKDVAAPRLAPISIPSEPTLPSGLQ